MGEGEGRETAARPDDDPGWEDGYAEQEASIADYATGDFADAGEKRPGPRTRAGRRERGDPTYR